MSFLMHAVIRCSAAAVALVATLTACSGGANPTIPSADASAANLDGVTLGSGGRATSETTQQTTTAADSGSTAGRGGVTLGSGS